MSKPKLPELQETFDKLLDGHDPVDDVAGWLRDNLQYLDTSKRQKLLKNAAVHARHDLLDALEDQPQLLKSAANLFDVVEELVTLTTYTPEKAMQAAHTMIERPTAYRLACDERSETASAWDNLYRQARMMDDFPLRELHRALYPDVNLRDHLSDKNYTKWVVRMTDPASIDERLDGYRDPDNFHGMKGYDVSYQTAVVGTALRTGRRDVAEHYGWPDEDARVLLAAMTVKGYRESYEWYADHAPNEQAVRALFAAFFQNSSMRSESDLDDDYERTAPMFDLIVESDLVDECLEDVPGDGNSSDYTNLLLFAQHLHRKGVLKQHQQTFLQALMKHGSRPSKTIEAERLAKTGLDLTQLPEDELADWLAMIDLEPLDRLLDHNELSDRTYEELFERMATKSGGVGSNMSRQLSYLESHYYEPDDDFGYARKSALKGKPGVLSHYLDKLGNLNREQTEQLYNALLDDSKADKSSTSIPAKLKIMARHDILPPESDPVYKKLIGLGYFEFAGERELESMMALAEKRALPSPETLRDIDRIVSDHDVIEQLRPHLNKRQANALDQYEAVEE